MSVSRVRAVNGAVYNESGDSYRALLREAYPLLVHSNIVVPQPRIDSHYPVGCWLRQFRVAATLSVLDVFLDKCNAQNFIPFGGAASCGRCNPPMQERRILLVHGRLGRSGFCLVASDIEILHEIVDSWRALLDPRLEISVESQNVLTDLSISLLAADLFSTMTWASPK